MSAWTEDELAQMRAYMGFPSLFHQREPRLENAMRSVQSTADGGVLSSTATQDRMRATLAALASIEAAITATYCTLGVDSAGAENVRINSTRKLFVLKGEGRRLIGQLAIPLGTRPVRGYFDQPEYGDVNSSNPFTINDL